MNYHVFKEENEVILFCGLQQKRGSFCGVGDIHIFFVTAEPILVCNEPVNRFTSFLILCSGNLFFIISKTVTSAVLFLSKGQVSGIVFQIAP